MRRKTSSSPAWIGRLTSSHTLRQIGDGVDQVAPEVARVARSGSESAPARRPVVRAAATALRAAPAAAGRDRSARRSGSAAPPRGCRAPTSARTSSTMTAGRPTALAAARRRHDAVGARAIAALVDGDALGDARQAHAPGPDRSGSARTDRAGRSVDRGRSGPGRARQSGRHTGSARASPALSLTQPATITFMLRSRAFIFCSACSWPWTRSSACWRTTHEYSTTTSAAPASRPRSARTSRGSPPAAASRRRSSGSRWSRCGRCSRGSSDVIEVTAGSRSKPAYTY